MNETQKALNFRFACKIFDKTKKIPQDILRDILDAGRLAPSSFGLEQWKFLVVQDEKIKLQLLPACYNQEQISTCSDLVVILGRNDVRKDTDYFLKCLDRFGDNREVMKNTLEGFISRLDDREYDNWVSKQCYIASSHMMIVSASLGVDSCPMEGFDAKKVYNILNLKDDVFVATLLPLGYRKDNPKREKERYPFQDIVSFA